MNANSHLEPDHDILIIGAGLEALTLLSKMSDTMLKKTVVIDSTGDWLASFKSKISKLGITHLNSPMTLHPHVRPGALIDFAHHQQQQAAGRHTFTNPTDPIIIATTTTTPSTSTNLPKQHGLSVRPSATSRPSVSLFLDFCEKKIIQQLPQHLRKPIHATVTNITSSGTTTTIIISSTTTISLSNGKQLSTKAVVYTASNTRAVIPPAFRTLVDDHGGHNNIVTWDKVDFSSSSSTTTYNNTISGKRVAIIGGGCTAALLAINAIDQHHHHHHQQGSLPAPPPAAAHVTLIVRGQLKQSWQEIDPGWWGPKYLNGYTQQPSPYQRMMACRRARQYTVITPVQWNRLVELSCAGRVTVLEECEVDKCTTTSSSSSSRGTRSNNDDGTTTILDLTLHSNNNNNNNNMTDFMSSVHTSSSLTTATTTISPPQSIEVDTVWLACGSAYNASHDPLLSSSSSLLSESLAMHTVGGYLVVDDTTLAVATIVRNVDDGSSSSSSSSSSSTLQTTPVFMLGRGAQIALGPASRDLAGWRLGASLIVKALKTLDYSSSIAATNVHNNSNTSYKNTTTLKEEEGERVPLEEEGCQYYPGKRRKPVACPPHLVNMSDIFTDDNIDENITTTCTTSTTNNKIPKYEIQKYAFVDEGFKIKVYIDLDKHKKSSGTTKVRSVLTERSIDVWALVDEDRDGKTVVVAAYHLFIPLLYGRILPNKSKVSVSSSNSNTVRINLHKIADGEWRFLKG